MSRTLNFAVLGSGNGARAFCGQIGAKGFGVVMYEPLEATKDYFKLRKNKKLYLEGDIVAEGNIKGLTMDMKEAVKDAHVVLVVVPSFAHKPIFEKLIPELDTGQHIFIVPGNYGGLLLKKMISDNGIKTDITISEMSTLPYACRISSYDTVKIYKRKSSIKIASSPAIKNEEAIRIMYSIFGNHVRFISGQNLLEIDLDNINQTLHPLPVLLNYGCIENNPKSFKHYMDGVTPLISKKMSEIDKERMAIGEAFSLNLISTLNQLKMYYGDNDSETYYEYVNSAESPYKDIVGHSVRSRYLTEDIPCLHVPASNLAKRVGVEAPLTELCIRLASELHGVDYTSKGYSLLNLGIEHKKPDEIVGMTT